MNKYLALAVELNDFMYDVKAMMGIYIQPNPHITEERVDKLIKEYQTKLKEWGIE